MDTSSLDSASISANETLTVTPIPCTSAVPCNQDDASQPVLSFDISAILSARNATSSILTNQDLTNELRAAIESIRRDLDKGLETQRKDSEKVNEDLQKLRKDLETKQTEIETYQIQIQQQHKAEIKELKKQLIEYNISTHESRISQIESQLLVETEKQMEERKAMRIQRVETNKALPDSAKKSQFSRDRQDSGLSLTSLNSIDETGEYTIDPDPGYSSAASSRSSSYSELTKAVGGSGGGIRPGITLDPVPESP